MANGNTNETPERLSALEESKRQTESQFSAVFAKLEHIETLLSARQSTNWGLIISAIFLVGAIWAASVRPLQNDLDRGSVTAEKLSAAVLVQNNIINEMRLAEARMGIEISGIQGQVKEYAEHGTPTMSRAVEAMGGRIDLMQNQIANLIAIGSPSVEKRMGLIEYRLDHPNIPPIMPPPPTGARP